MTNTRDYVTTRQALRGWVKQQEEIIERLTKERDEARTESTKLSNHLMELIGSSACEEHNKLISSQSFGEFYAEQKAMGCLYCAIKERDEAREALKASTELLAIREEQLQTELRELEQCQAKAAAYHRAGKNLLEMFDHEVPPNFGANGNVAPDGSDEGQVLTWRFIEDCRKALSPITGSTANVEGREDKNNV